MKNILVLDNNNVVISVKQTKSSYVLAANETETKSYHFNKLGFSYDRLLKSFTDNQIASRIISVEQFIERIPETAFETIVDHPSKQAKAFISKLTILKSVNLDGDFVTGYATKMRAAGLITAAEKTAMLA